MSHNTAHHVEESEHAKHHASDPFDRRVAMSMAIVAAALACITMLSHRSHNATLENRTRASNQWNYYQAKKNRGYMYEALADLVGELKPTSTETKEPGGDEEQSDAKPPSGEKKSGKNKPPAERWRETAAKYEADGEKIQEEAKALEHAADHAHHMSALFDLGELGVELALVFCSLAVLTKRFSFWCAGIVLCIIGFAIAMLAYTPFGVDLIAKFTAH